MNGIEIDNASGRKWARFALVATLAVSVIANITHAVLAKSDITLWLRVPGAAIWPVLSFLAIEIIVRINWRRTFAHALARLFILGPAIPAVIVSYEHQERLLRMMGESGLVQAIGPLAIDGLMIGCTLALLFTRERIEQVVSMDVDASAEVASEREQEPTLAPIEPAPVMPAPVMLAPVEPAPRLHPHRPGHAARAASLIWEGATPASAASETDLSVQAARKYAQVVRRLREDHNAPIDARKMGVRGEVVDAIRARARQERAL